MGLLFSEIQKDDVTKHETIKQHEASCSDELPPLLIVDEEPADESTDAHPQAPAADKESDDTVSPLALDVFNIPDEEPEVTALTLYIKKNWKTGSRQDSVELKNQSNDTKPISFIFIQNICLASCTITDA